jgi:hypothetical protein
MDSLHCYKIRLKFNISLAGWVSLGIEVRNPLTAVSGV